MATRRATRGLAAVLAVLLALAVAVLAWVLASRPSPEAAPFPGGATASVSTGTATAAPSQARPERGRGTATATADASREAPAWISISAGGVDGPLVPQGLSPEGVIDPGREEIIWFTGGDRVVPGEVGTAVVAAHVTWEGAPDAFARLPEVGVGDVVTLGWDDGSEHTFTVTETAAVDKEQLARSLAVWGPHPDVPRLAIITCDPSLGYADDGHTEANYVVVAEG